MTTWHVPADLLDRFLEGGLPPAQVMSVEAHLTGCGRCRALVPADEEWLARSWDRIEAAVDRPPLGERLLAGAGTPPHLARLLLATPGLSRAWLLSLLGVLCFGVGAAHLTGGDPRVLLVFLAVAPVMPLAGIALAYGPAADPAYETHAATPLAGARLLLLRAGAVLTIAVALTGAAAPLLPEPAGPSAAWLLPSLALTLACMVLSTRLPLAAAAGGLSALWVAAVLSTQQLDRFLLFHGAAQAAYGAALPVLLLLLYARRRRLDPVP
ncbi:zf-HC2 domain-containing protein [Actinomadura rubrisoli]|uniref:Zf-HC2 domain-containing protein n=1 Tax=Actinomadura rubrisoli TaxID=2530368 RepID=A0A4R5B9Q4_9ACTN|nr:zf-HC2 domain-containing protein [Actinomadura rubrisoli]TDD80112.1 zf-HC2 domain-containing protein [Actinomadura rubrisoli]